jgi:NADPH-dependent 2,4-dienoyl-CoA reductase/sulfur reductase-like enzyme/peroxiredoxin family protein/TusA-related sulfurtransferase/rhodanese-related sulfurtransferase
MKVLIVGGVAGGASAGARLRRLDEKAEIIIFEKGEYISYANCGLPYYIGEVITERDNLLLNTPESFKSGFNIDVRVNNEVISVDGKNKSVQVMNLKTGEAYSESYDSLILCPGSVPAKLPFAGAEAESVFTLWTVPDTDRIKKYIDEKSPKSAVVIGGGFIGLEMVENLIHRNIAVSLVEMRDQVMNSVDFEIAQSIHKELADKGVALYLKNGVQKIEYTEAGTKVALTDGAVLTTDLVIMSPGVKPQTDFLASSGIKLNKRGGIIVDNSMRTSLNDVYAAGDAVEIADFITGEPAMIPLAGPANKQGRIAADNICGIASAYEATQGTSIAKILDIVVASTGMNEKSAAVKGMKPGTDYDVAVLHPKSHASYDPGAMPMTIKLIYRLIDGKILGAQAVGYEGVDKRIDVIAACIRKGCTVGDLTELELTYAPPFSSAKDPVNMAGYIAENIISGKVRMITWDRVKEIEDPLFIDVREQVEFDTGSIDGAKLIPVGEIRSRLAELDRNRNIIVFCAVGLRGYYAYRILAGNGFKNIWNLNGGLTIYRAANWKYVPSEPLSDNSGDEKKMTNVTAEINNGQIIKLDACGLSCPGPIQAVFKKMENMKNGDVVVVTASDPGFKTDIASWCKRTNNSLLDVKTENRIVTARIMKGSAENQIASITSLSGVKAAGTDKTIVVFSGDLDKAIASFIIANGAAAMGRKVTMFFTFWGLNILRKSEKQNIKKDFISTMFAFMMPRGAKKLGLSRMNMLGAGPVMIKSLMNKHNVPLLEDQIQAAVKSGVNIIACRMSMDLMGITEAELIDGISYAGVAAYLDAAEDANVNLFI